MRREARKKVDFIPDQVEDDNVDTKEQKEPKSSLFKR